MSAGHSTRLSALAVAGGEPVRPRPLPYGRQSIDERDVEAVREVLFSDWLTTGPKVTEFERAFGAAAGVPEAVTLSSGTAALHAAMYALGVGPGDEVLVPPLTFAATANCVVYQGGTPVFVDVDPLTGLIDPNQVSAKINSRTKAIIAVDYAGQPCDYKALESVAKRNGLRLVADACHSLGGAYCGHPVGSLADISVFSLHPVKAVTAGEGGVLTTADPELARRARLFRSHGIAPAGIPVALEKPWHYEMLDLGYNYRLTDIQCALGLSQLSKLKGWIASRQAIAATYDRALAGVCSPLVTRTDVEHAYHLYVIQLPLEYLQTDRAAVLRALRAEGILATVHYIPVHLHPYYRSRFETKAGLCPAAEALYERILTLPLFPAMTSEDVEDVINAVRKVLVSYTRQ